MFEKLDFDLIRSLSSIGVINLSITLINKSETCGILILSKTSKKYSLLLSEAAHKQINI